MITFTSRTDMNRTTLAALFVVLLFGSTYGSVRPAGAEPHKAAVTLLKDTRFVEALLTGIMNSRKSIVCCYHLFVIKGKNASEGVLAELVRARQRGVEVKVILEKTRQDVRLNEENLHTAALLSRGGIKVYFDNPDVVTHLKVTVIDNRYVFLGSHNLTEGSLRQNNELSVLIDSPEIAGETLSYLNQL
jgi:phosphatidylserine/phosphatidylglycerophosphate/cardiolipin synthase-like enzyme